MVEVWTAGLPDRGTAEHDYLDGGRSFVDQSETRFSPTGGDNMVEVTAEHDYLDRDKSLVDWGERDSSTGGDDMVEVWTAEHGYLDEKSSLVDRCETRFLTNWRRQHGRGLNRGT